MIRNARIIDESEYAADEVHLGAVVKVRISRTTRLTSFRSSARPRPIRRIVRISNESPLGRALMGHKKGATVDVATPRGLVKYKIESIKSSAPKKADKKSESRDGRRLEEFGKTEAALVAARRENLAALRSRGNDPFAQRRCDVDATAPELTRALRLSRAGAGRVGRRTGAWPGASSRSARWARRSLPTWRDRTGLLQIYVRKQDVGRRALRRLARSRPRRPRSPCADTCSARSSAR